MQAVYSFIELALYLSHNLFNWDRQNIDLGVCDITLISCDMHILRLLELVDQL